jgi:hypothetical protein
VAVGVLETQVTQQEKTAVRVEALEAEALELELEALGILRLQAQHKEAMAAIVLQIRVLVHLVVVAVLLQEVETAQSPPEQHLATEALEAHLLLLVRQ